MPGVQFERFLLSGVVSAKSNLKLNLNFENGKKFPHSLKTSIFWLHNLILHDKNYVLLWRVLGFLVCLRSHDTFHVSRPSVAAGNHGAWRCGKSIWQLGLFNLQKLLQPNLKSFLEISGCPTCLLFVILKLLKLLPTLPLRALSLSQSSIALYSDSRASFLSFAASEWSSFKPSLATFWNFFPSNSGRACMQYSSTGSTKYKTYKKQ